jgi:Zn-dependent metalloprotease
MTRKFFSAHLTRGARFALSLAATSFGVLAASCSASLDQFEDDPDPEVSVASGGRGSSLREMGFQVAQMGRAGTPSYLSGRIPAAIRDGNDARALMAQTLAGSYRLAPGTDFEVLSDRADDQGYRYLKLRQLHGKVPVAGSEVVLQVAEDGAVLAVLGQLTPDLNMSMSPGLSGDVAISRALSRLATGAQVVHEKPALQVFTREDGSAVLSWRAVVEYVGQKGRALETIYVDAQSGDVLAQHSRIFDGLSRTIYDMKSGCLRTGSELPGTLLLNEGGTTTDTAASAVYTNLGATYWFYKHFLGRDSYDGAGALLKSSVHTKFSTGISCSGANAAWLDAPYNQMVYGDGDGTNFRPLTSMDVSGHELTHAVTARTSNLTYSNESGALNEAMSDILGGAGAEAWQQSGGTQAGNPANFAPNANTWKIGEEVVIGGLPGGVLRSMSNPTIDNYSKDYYPERITGTQDNGGVHGNSGIANLAFYLLSQGGTHPRGKTTTAVGAIGLQKALKIFYTANSTLMNSSTNFQGARNATAQAAQNLYGNCSAEWTNTHKAWDAVGVPGTWTPCGGGGDTTPPTATLTSPAAGATLSGTATLAANASDNVGVTVVEFYSGTALIGSDNTAPYSVTWNTTGVANGTYSLTAKAKDAAGNVGTSAAVAVTVNNGGGGGGGTNEVEPNNSTAQANAVSSPKVMKGTIATSADRDFFVVQLPAGKTLTAALTSPTGADYDLYVYNSNGALIGFSLRGVGVVDQVSVKNSGTSTFARYIEVRHYSGASATQTYSLNLTW